jgi:hypothetical protein
MQHDSKLAECEPGTPRWYQLQLKTLEVQLRYHHATKEAQLYAALQHERKQHMVTRAQCHAQANDVESMRKQIETDCDREADLRHQCEALSANVRDKELRVTELERGVRDLGDQFRQERAKWVADVAKLGAELQRERQERALEAKKLAAFEADELVRLKPTLASTKMLQQTHTQLAAQCEGVATELHARQVLEQAFECCVCRAERATHANIGCGHVLCLACWSKIDKCALCKGEKIDVIAVFVPGVSS